MLYLSKSSQGGSAVDSILSFAGFGRTAIIGSKAKCPWNVKKGVRSLPSSPIKNENRSPLLSFRRKVSLIRLRTCAIDMYFVNVPNSET